MYLLTTTDAFVWTLLCPRSVHDTHTHKKKYIEGNTIDNIGSVAHTFNSHTYTQTNMIVFDTHTHTNINTHSTAHTKNKINKLINNIHMYFL